MKARTLLAVLLGVVPLAPAAEAVREDVPVSASCVVQIDFDPVVTPLDSHVVSDLLASTALSRPAARKAGIGDWRYYVTSDVLQYDEKLTRRSPVSGRYNLGPGSPMVRSRSGRGGVSAPRPSRGVAAQPSLSRGVIVVSVAVQMEGGTEAQAGKFLAALCSELRDALIAPAKAGSDRFKEDLAQAIEEMRRAEARMKDLQAERTGLSAEAKLADLSRAKILRRFEELEGREQEAIALRLAGHRAREQALTLRIAAAGREASAKLKEDPVIGQLKKMYELRFRQVDSLKKAQAKGGATEDEVRQAEAQLIEAQIQLAQREQDVNRAAGGALMEKLNEELALLAVAAAEDEAKLKALERLRAELGSKRDLLSLADRYERVELDLRLVTQEYELARHRKGELSRQLQSIRLPTVTVMGNLAEK